MSDCSSVYSPRPCTSALIHAITNTMAKRYHQGSMKKFARMAAAIDVQARAKSHHAGQVPEKWSFFGRKSAFFACVGWRTDSSTRELPSFASVDR